MILSAVNANFLTVNQGTQDMGTDTTVNLLKK